MNKEKGKDHNLYTVISKINVLVYWISHLRNFTIVCVCFIFVVLSRLHVLTLEMSIMTI